MEKNIKLKMEKSGNAVKVDLFSGETLIATLVESENMIAQPHIIKRCFDNIYSEMLYKLFTEETT